VDCLGRDTLVQLAKAGPEAQAEILGSLGLKGYMIMDSTNPVNLFNSASGIIGSLPGTNNGNASGNGALLPF
jgi:major vault protein